MGCGCGGNRPSSAVSYTPPGARYVPQEVYVATYPDGRTQEFDTEAAAIGSLRNTGGGISRKLKV